MFRLMPPQRHDADPDRSEVLKYIQENLRCDLARSIRAFNSMRNKKSEFKEESKTGKAVHVTYITPYGVKENAYAQNVQSEVTLDDLFKE